MATNDKEKLQAFAQKMHDEGAAGFASGLTPWETWDDFEDRVSSRVWQGTAEHVTDRDPPSRSFGDRVMTAMTVLAVATLVTGIAGVYITQKPTTQIADNNTQLHPTAPIWTQKLQLPEQGPGADTREETVASADASIAATEKIPASPVAFGIRTIGTTEGSSGVSSANHAALTEPGTDSSMALAIPDSLPAPAAGMPAIVSAGPVPDPAMNDVTSTPGQASIMNRQSGAPEATTADPGISARVQSIQLSRATLLDTPAEVLLPPKQDITQPEPTGKSGDWSINLASYIKASTAEKMKNRFLDKGVVANQVVATVKGKTYYRLRVTGFETRQAALAESTGIKEKLGLKDIWITKK